MKHVTNTELPAGSAIVILNISPYGRVKIGDDKKTAFPELNKVISDLFKQVDSEPQTIYPSVKVANLLIQKYDGEITLIESADSTGIELF